MFRSTGFSCLQNIFRNFVTDYPYLESNTVMEAKEDAYYIAEVLKGNTAAFSPLVDKYKQLAFTLSMKIVRNREDAEDAAQDAFVKAYKSLGSFKGGAAFKTWLFRIVYTTAISKVRGKKENRISLEDYKLSDSDLLDAENAMGQLTEEERSFHLHKALEKLAADEQALLNLYYFDDLPVEEIASIMDMSASNVKIKLFRTRKKLYGQLHFLLESQSLYVE